jgi:hypothetical protein
MPEPYEELEDDHFDYGGDWFEWPEGAQPGGGGAFSASSQEATLVGYVAANPLRAALRYFLGYSQTETSQPPDAGGEEPEVSAGEIYRLRREPPARHPQFPQLYCHAVGFSGLGIKGVANEPIYLTSPFQDYLGEDLKYASYESYVLTLKFKSYGLTRFLSDEEMDGYDPPYAYEWLRWSSFEVGPAVQALTADGSSQLIFREGGGDPHPVAGTDAFPAPLAELLAKASLTVKWMGVPHDWISDNEYYLFPSKVISLLGHVNDADLFGNPTGTMLFTAATFEPTLFPVAPADPSQPLVGWDVTFVFEQYDPPKGVEASAYRGHRVFPWRKTGKHYYCSRENAADELLPLGSLYKLFQHVLDES